jgi:hypothetical protein
MKREEVIMAKTVEELLEKSNQRLESVPAWLRSPAGGTEAMWQLPLGYDDRSLDHQSDQPDHRKRDRKKDS